MNNIRGNNRRRGRGSNRQQGGHQGGQQQNRIDSRARGNAPQMLEKFRKLAHDAHLNGDRVQEESYLQFADHYFRVMADQKQRQEEARQPRREDRPPDQDESGYGEDNAASGYEAKDTSSGRDRDDRGDYSDYARGSDGPEDLEYERPDNPFIRETRSDKPHKPRRGPRREDENDGDAKMDEAEAASGLDPSALPPAISGKDEEIAGGGKEATEAKPRRRTRRTQPPRDDSGEALEVVN